MCDACAHRHVKILCERRPTKVLLGIKTRFIGEKRDRHEAVRGLFRLRFGVSLLFGIGITVATAIGIHPNFAGTLILTESRRSTAGATPDDIIAQLYFHDVAKTTEVREPGRFETGSIHRSGRPTAEKDISAGDVRKAEVAARGPPQNRNGSRHCAERNARASRARKSVWGSATT